VRRLCPACRFEKAPSEVLLAQLPTRPPADFKFYESRGCAECRNTGFVGRMLVFELLMMNEHLATGVLNRQSQNELTRAAVANGMKTMLQDGLEKVRAGETSLVELMRVVQ
jgi:type II secretory ATPase GspE/PulE/Tfp pilus assembly ATPase PilB-like protein